MPRSTSFDVAKLAGTSRATVSYVLNGRTDQSISDATRHRVLQAAQQLDYVPNAASRALRAGSSKLVMLVNSGIPWSTNVSDLEDHLTSLVAGSGRSLIVWRRQGPDDLSTTLANLEPAVVISQDLLSEPERALLTRLHIPLVEVDIAFPGVDLPTRLQVEHLQAYGHERIGYLTTNEPTLQRFAAPRTEGFRAACAALGLPEPVVGAVSGGLAASADEVAALVSAWTTGDDAVTAIACFNDVHAAVCLAAAQRVGLWVPYDLAVMGLDDDIFAPITTPPLTTIRMDNRKFADHLWASAASQLGLGPVPKPFHPSAHVVERSSVRPD